MMCGSGQRAITALAKRTASEVAAGPSRCRPPRRRPARATAASGARAPPGAAAWPAAPPPVPPVAPLLPAAPLRLGPRAPAAPIVPAVPPPAPAVPVAPAARSCPRAAVARRRTSRHARVARVARGARRAGRARGPARGSRAPGGVAAATAAGAEPRSGQQDAPAAQENYLRMRAGIVFPAAPLRNNSNFRATLNMSRQAPIDHTARSPLCRTHPNLCREGSCRDLDAPCRELGLFSNSVPLSPGKDIAAFEAPGSVSSRSPSHMR